MFASERAAFRRFPASDATPNIGMSDQGHVFDLLSSHNAKQRPIFVVSPERNTLVDFMLQLFRGHIRLCPPIGWDDSLISLRTIIDDGQNRFEVTLVTATDHTCLNVASVSKVLSH